MFNRVKRFWQLSNKDPKAVEQAMSLTKEDLDYMPEIGDGNAVFFGEGTEQEYKDQLEEDKGFKGIFGK